MIALRRRIDIQSKTEATVENSRKESWQPNVKREGILENSVNEAVKELRSRGGDVSSGCNSRRKAVGQQEKQNSLLKTCLCLSPKAPNSESGNCRPPNCVWENSTLTDPGLVTQGWDLPKGSSQCTENVFASVGVTDLADGSSQTKHPVFVDKEQNAYGLNLRT